MLNHRSLRLLIIGVPLLSIGGCAASLRSHDGEIERIRQTEHQRLRSLVEANLTVARRLHADDFQLINPAGVPLSKDEYLGSIESGQLDYGAWEAGEIAVRVYGGVAIIRYRDLRFEVSLGGRLAHRGPMYHTNVYEKRGEQWQVVWSQASGVITPP